MTKAEVKRLNEMTRALRETILRLEQEGRPVDGIVFILKSGKGVGALTSYSSATEAMALCSAGVTEFAKQATKG